MAIDKLRKHTSDIHVYINKRIEFIKQAVTFNLFTSENIHMLMNNLREDNYVMHIFIFINNQIEFNKPIYNAHQLYFSS